jgi:ABC-type branched-subunit amino acid transport system substrate-binding protein
MQREENMPAYKFAQVTALAATLISGSAVAQDGPIRLGVFTATGPGAASMAEGTNVGAQYVFDEHNKKPDALKIEKVDVNIGAFDPATGLSSIRKAVLVDNILSFITAGSPLVLAARSFVEEQKVVTFSIAGSEAVIKDDNYVQQVMPFWSDEIAAMGEYLCSADSHIKDLKRVAVIAVGGAGGDGAVKAVEKWKDLCGIETVTVQRYSIPTTNFRPQLSALARVPADAVYIASLGGPENTAVVTQARQLGIELPLITPLAGPEKSLVENDAGEGLLFTSYVLADLPQPMAEAYEKLGSAVLFGFYYATVATQVLDDMKARNIPIEREAFRTALLEKRSFDIAGSTFCFNADGHTRIPMGIWQIHDKKKVQIKGASANGCN